METWLSIRSVIFLLLFGTILQGEHVRWSKNYEEAHKTALSQKRPLMVLLIDKKESRVLQDLFMDQDYIKKINSELISVIIMKDQKESYPIEMLYTLQYPAIFFLDKNELMLCESLSGVISSDALRKHLSKCY